jgi:hypothetical protein
MIHRAYLIFLVPCVALAISACKPKEEAAATVAATPPAAATSAPVAASTKPFDPESVPLSTATLPPFPYVQLPDPKAEGYHKAEQAVDHAFVVAGSELRPVDGRTMLRFFPPSVVKMSTLEAFRNYDNAIKAMGGVQVNTVHPLEDAFIKLNGVDRETLLKKLRAPNLERSTASDAPTFTQYLIRTAKGNVWISTFFFDGENNMGLLTIEEKPI